MPKKIVIDFQKWEKEHAYRGEAYCKRVHSIFEAAAEDAAKIGSTIGKSDPLRAFTFKDYPTAANRMNEVLGTLQKNVTATIMDATRSEWLEACKKNDEIVDKIFGRELKGGVLLDHYYQRNIEALNAFQTRKVAGLGLSERVWNYAEQFKEEIEMGLDMGISEGRSFTSLAADLKGYLRNPDKLFRRVRDKRGELVLSKHAKAYHPGAGQYRSASRNAQRTARTETNMAYRASDFERWQQFDFVLGIEVMLSNAHKIIDICDDLKGHYPKTFKFTGWHPQCFCFAVPILSDMEDAISGLRSERLPGTKPEDIYWGETVDKLPDVFTQWAATNKGRLSAASAEGRLPLFWTDNFEGLSTAALRGETTVSIAKASKAALIAKEAAAVKAIAAAEEAEAARLAKMAADAEEAAKAEELFAAEAAVRAEAERKLALLADKKAVEISAARKKITAAVELGIPEAEYSELITSIIDPTVSYSRVRTLGDKLGKLVKDVKGTPAMKTPTLTVKAAKASTAADTLSREALGKTYTRKELDGLFDAYDDFTARLPKAVDSRVEKLKFEIDWLKTHGKYSTSPEMSKMLQRDLDFLQKDAKAAAIRMETTSTITTLESMKYGTVKGKLAELRALEASSVKAGTVTTELQDALDELRKMTGTIKEAESIMDGYSKMKYKSQPMTEAVAAMKKVLASPASTRLDINAATRKMDAWYGDLKDIVRTATESETLLTKYAKATIKNADELKALSAALQTIKAGTMNTSAIDKMNDALYKAKRVIDEYEKRKAVIDKGLTIKSLYAAKKDVALKGALDEMLAVVTNESSSYAELYKAMEKMDDAVTVYETKMNKGNPLTLVNHKKKIEEWISSHSIKLSAAERVEAERIMTELCDKGDFAMRYKARDIQSIMNNGILNQIELRAKKLPVKSGGMCDPDTRIRASHDLFGTDLKKATPFDYEHYGYLADKDMMVELGNGGPDQYGDSIFYFKKSKVKATMSMVDSLGGSCSPSLTSSISISSCPAYKLPNIQEAYKAVGTKNLVTYREEFGGSYIELQYHGKIDLSMVEKILIPYDDVRHYNDAMVATLKAKYGIKVYVQRAAGGDIKEW